VSGYGYNPGAPLIDAPMGELPDKRTAFIEWYLDVIEAAQLTDKRYPVKGMNVWTPYGFRARRCLDAVLIREIEATGSDAVEFPALIPSTEFAKEAEHIQGFNAQVYWVTKGGLAELDVPLVLRPTSETAMYPIFSLWVRSHRDLPLNVYQIVNTFRYETKTTRPFMRVREIHFFEEHTCQADEDAATARVASNLGAFAKMAEAFDLPYISVRRPEWDKFAGAFYSIALDIPVGEGGRSRSAVSTTTGRTSPDRMGSSTRRATGAPTSPTKRPSDFRSGFSEPSWPSMGMPRGSSSRPRLLPTRSSSSRSRPPRAPRTRWRWRRGSRPDCDRADGGSMSMLPTHDPERSTTSGSSAAPRFAWRSVAARRNRERYRPPTDSAASRPSRWSTSRRRSIGASPTSIAR